MTTMAGFPRRNEELSFEDFPSENQLALPSSMTDGFIPEPWMKEMLDESAMNNTHLDWDIIDSFNSNTVSFSSNTNSSAMPATQETPMTANDWSNDSLGHFQTSSMLPDPNLFGQSDYQSTCPSLSPETPFMDYSPSLDQFASFDTTSALPSPSMGDASQAVFDQVAAAFRDLARARAEADPRPLSRKQKQREASIALYLQRLRDTCNEACAMLGSDAAPQHSLHQFEDSMNASQQLTQNTSFAPLMAFFQPSVAPTNSPVNGICNESARPSPNAFTAPTTSTTGSPAPPPKKARTATPVTGGVELVMDLNMNVATTMPRKHKPRTQAQRERYLAVRSQGACEKHKRQHKRCTCVDDMVDAALGKQGQNGVKRSRATRTSQPKGAMKRKTDRPGATTRTTTTSQLQQAGHPSGFCLGGCHGECSCFTHDIDDLHWQYLQFSAEQQQQPLIRNQEHCSDGREVHAKVNSRVDAPPRQSCSPPAKPPRASPDENSPVTWDIAAVSRTGCLRDESQNISLQTMTAQNTRPQNNRTSTISTSIIDQNTNAAAPNVSADGRQPVAAQTSDTDVGILRTRTGFNTSSTSRTSADSGPLQSEWSRQQQQVSWEQPSSSSLPSSSSSLFPVRSDHAHPVDLRRERDRSGISDRNVASQLIPEHAQQMRQNRDPDVFIFGNRNISAPGQRSPVNSGTLPPCSIDNRYIHRQQYRDDALRFSTSIVKRGEGCEYAEQQKSDCGTNVLRNHFGDRAIGSNGAMNDASYQHRAGRGTSLNVHGDASGATSFVGTRRPISSPASAPLNLNVSSLRSVLAVLASSMSISLSRALNSSSSGGRTITRNLRKGHEHGPLPLESLGPWLFIWAVCLFFSALGQGSAIGARNSASMGAELFLQRLT